ncbi:uncharacterized protein LOC128642379 [Bombina bombina]|uniref:uncharacterized protein LOC128642379 n=1 Tax=Bombina bombina TaxID=8345 RepID=UPI00235A5550|nr:uncharacterized protein LOC128642379 [Bombina bombina]
MGQGLSSLFGCCLPVSQTPRVQERQRRDEDNARKVLHTVCIFSRDDQSNYNWLAEILNSRFGNNVKEVRHFFISNNGFPRFKEEVSKCTFAILYHTKNRGRINITDVTDSLYEDELEHLFTAIGAENTIIVIDDLEQSDQQEKDRILQEQSKIKSMARDLFLFNREEKQSLLRAQNNQLPYEKGLQDKIQLIQEIMSKGVGFSIRHSKNY